MKFTKDRPKTEIEELRASVPNFDYIKLESRTTVDGKIIYFDTTHPILKRKLKEMGFYQIVEKKKKKKLKKKIKKKKVKK